MMQTLPTICLWATFIATGVSLSCENCLDFGHTCEGLLEPCSSDEDACGIMQVKISGVLETEFVMKTCLHSRDCYEPLSSMDFGMAGQLLVQTTCCMENECEEFIPPLPPINTSPNGKKCPACLAVNSFQCKDIVAECTGDNNYCAELTATGNFDNVSVHFVLKGCMSHDVCKDVHGDSSSDLFDIASCVISSKAPSTVPGSSQLFLQIFSGLLLLQILK
ncbi:phospholipase A2 inhibitor gamma subunit B-like [Eublepharis macularius]|uniref:Phospholipase A2 inhibitor gamma subunit B-like n=1 Tax=Eublepharis macularius TaxID=481883 RepID=A0AA97KGW2_EUBMA|nr:phospholipase A2 inhibitor gamma subunit B-like [Eublepharis macularius]